MLSQYSPSDNLGRLGARSQRFRDQLFTEQKRWPNHHVASPSAFIVPLIAFQNANRDVRPAGKYQAELNSTNAHITPTISSCKATYSQRHSLLHAPTVPRSLKRSAGGYVTDNTAEVGEVIAKVENTLRGTSRKVSYSYTHSQILERRQTLEKPLRQRCKGVFVHASAGVDETRKMGKIRHV